MISLRKKARKGGAIPRPSGTVVEVENIGVIASYVPGTQVALLKGNNLNMESK